ncbi:ABC transporter permease [Rhodoferax aquaticus]|uniref:FtsX-like permease family protein n=1 Tax=Rhodoferax aquaticus TaxID=2527691 RepID=A0A515ELI3_9BURK|nr:FtsX-like permease family protein [Rhodoferax aquaticus]QDL53494.1 FtsX-like permease family protein [Rhodoferax aquaticus]
MKTLDRKLLRDLRLMWSQALTIALVVASGVGGFITSFSAYDSLSWSRDVYYAESRFADVFSSLKSAPWALQGQLETINGAAHVQAGLAQVVPIAIPGVSDPIAGQLIGLDPGATQQLNVVSLRKGRMVAAHGSGAMEALVSEAFAEAHQLKMGDEVTALINGKRERLRLVGIGLSPEFIFAGLGGSPDQRGFGIFWIDRQALATAYNMEGAFNQVTVRLSPGASEGAVIDQLDRLLGPYGGISAHGRDQQLSDVILNSEIKQQRMMGTVLPSIFLAVAAFLLNVVLGRQIASQREQVAALKALGYSNRAIGLHYLKFVLLIVVLGLVVGVALGAALGQGFVGLYAKTFRFPTLHYRLAPALMLIAAGVALAAAVLATLSAIRATVLLAPAEAMRPPSPGAYRPMLLERWGMKDWFSPPLRMILRTMERHRLRTLPTTLGVAMAMATVITGAFMRDAVAVLMDTQFRQVLRGDVSINLREATAARVLQSAAQLPYVTAVEGARNVSVRLVNANHHHRGAIQGKPEVPDLFRIVNLDRRALDAPRHGLLLTDRLAAKLRVKPGDMVRVEVQEGRREIVNLPVTGTVHELLGMNAYMERRALNAVLHEGDMVNQIMVAVERGHEPELLNRLKELPQVGVAISKQVMARNITDVTARNILVFSLVLTVFATVIAVGVVYNNARIALAERAWELASLRVLGFTRTEVSAILLGELGIEIALALPLGMGLGYLLALGIVTLIRSDEFSFPFAIQPATYAFAVVCVVVAGVISALIVRRRIDQLDLVGVLKTRE